LVCQSVGIRGISRVLKIATNTVLERIKRIADAITQPPIQQDQSSF
jgi:transposase-like protein